MRFRRSIGLPVDADEAFAWHARPGAFERLRPPWQRIEVIDRRGGVEDGGRLTFRIYRGPLPLRWVAEHRDVEPGRQFRDVQIAGPFAAWSHVHRFESRPAGSELTDEIDCELPLGVLGRLGSGFLRRDLQRVFAFRHRTTRGDLEAHAGDRQRPRLRVAIAGAGGLIGSALAAFLTTGGHTVWRLVRRRQAGDGEVAWDPETGPLQPQRLEELDAVVYLAGANIAAGRWSERRKQMLVKSRVDAVQRLVKTLGELERPPRAFVCASAVGFYGDCGERTVTEEAPAGDGFLADLARRWEDAAGAAGDWGARVALPRFGVVLSAAGGALAKMLPAFRAGAGGPLGSGRQLLSWVALDDAVGAVYQALRSDELSGPVNVVAPRPLAQRDFARVLGRVLRRPALAPLPAAVLRLLFGEMADETLLASTGVLPERLTKSGYRFRHPALEGALRHELGFAD